MKSDKYNEGFAQNTFLDVSIAFSVTCCTATVLVLDNYLISKMGLINNTAGDNLL